MSETQPLTHPGSVLSGAQRWPTAANVVMWLIMGACGQRSPHAVDLDPCAFESAGSLTIADALEALAQCGNLTIAGTSVTARSVGKQDLPHRIRRVTYLGVWPQVACMTMFAEAPLLPASERCALLSTDVDQAACLAGRKLSVPDELFVPMQTCIGNGEPIGPRVGMVDVVVVAGAGDAGLERPLDIAVSMLDSNAHIEIEMIPDAGEHPPPSGKVNVPLDVLRRGMLARAGAATVPDAYCVEYSNHNRHCSTGTDPDGMWPHDLTLDALDGSSLDSIFDIRPIRCWLPRPAGDAMTPTTHLAVVHRDALQALRLWVDTDLEAVERCADQALTPMPKGVGGGERLQRVRLRLNPLADRPTPDRGR